MAIFFTADPHFSLGDFEGTVKRDFRPFESVEQMNQTIIEVWNKQASKDDTIYLVGDFVNYNLKDKQHFDFGYGLVQKINAKVILILGNNDERVMQYEFDNNFDKFKDYLLSKGFFDVIQEGLDLELDDKQFYLTHYPTKHKEGVVNLFGHVHGCVFVKKYGFNVGLDNHYLGLFSESEILELVDRQKFYDENIYN